ncbi:acyltransferase family protein [Legionella drancourtii]|uniref:acyltransferase family protein n=1 Tax=Legionella drancourtii TaxID=168933 RepID=UPI0001B018E5|nr:acyltransferase [Legionella drancourtii]
MINKNADGLRGVAAFSVAVAHFISAFLPMMAHKNYPQTFSENTSPSLFFEILTSPLISIFYNGHFAVLLFFVLSGYVLTFPYFTAEANILSLKRRLWGRYLRLNIPIACVIFLSFIVYQMGWYKNIPAAEISGSVIWFKNFFAEQLTLKMAVNESIYDSLVFGKHTFIPSLWTLKIEFIGSIYVLAFFIVKPKERIIIPMILVFAILFLVHKEDSIYFYALFLGSLLNLMKLNFRTRRLVFAIGFYLGAFQFECIAYDYLPEVLIWEKKAFYHTIGALFMALAIIKGFGEQFFQHKFIQFLGKISFSLYLIHFIILCSLSSALYLHFPQTQIMIALNFCLYVTFCLIASKIFELMVDKPAINLSHQFSSWLLGMVKKKESTKIISGSQSSLQRLTSLTS